MKEPRIGPNPRQTPSKPLQSAEECVAEEQAGLAKREAHKWKLPWTPAFTPDDVLARPDKVRGGVGFEGVGGGDLPRKVGRRGARRRGALRGSFFGVGKVGLALITTCLSWAAAPFRPSPCCTHTPTLRGGLPTPPPPHPTLPRPPRPR
jgi:hypothetical protein